METEFSSKLVQDYLNEKEVGVLATINADGRRLAMPLIIHSFETVQVLSTSTQYEYSVLASNLTVLVLE